VGRVTLIAVPQGRLMGATAPTTSSEPLTKLSPAGATEPSPARQCREASKQKRIRVPQGRQLIARHVSAGTGAKNGFESRRDGTKRPFI
jgi:hypothetical protein